jgi:hypothetical protein
MNSLTVKELRDMLEEMPDDAEVRFAQQPSYPLEYTVRDVVQVDVNGMTEDEELEVENICEETGANRFDVEANIMNGREPEWVVYLVEGQQIGYLPGCAASEIGWR